MTVVTAHSVEYKKIVFATANSHKLSEAERILTEFRVLSPLDFGISEDVEETGSTLEENSLLKARFIYSKTHCACFADDTGLEVDALGGAPGVMTARYAGPQHDNAANMAKLLSELASAGGDRKARFRTVVTLILEDGSEHQFCGLMHGHIALQKSGANGFGYDPVFVPDFLANGCGPNTEGLSLAEYSDSDKDAISHRGAALRLMRDFLKS